MLRSVLIRLSPVILLLLIMVVVHVYNSHQQFVLHQFGVLPRSIEGIHHILIAPFIHASYAHLISNVSAFVVLASLIILRSNWLFIWGSVLIILLGGLLVWLFGRQAYHFGASGWVYGLWALTLSIAWFDRKLINVLVAMLVLFFYGGMSFGLLPLDLAISFEMHLAGVVAGVLCGFLYAMMQKSKKRAEDAVSRM